MNTFISLLELSGELSQTHQFFKNNNNHKPKMSGAIRHLSDGVDCSLQKIMLK